MQQIADWLEKLGMSEYAHRNLRMSPPSFWRLHTHIPHVVRNPHYTRLS
jgi:hypothetical protein